MLRASGLTYLMTTMPRCRRSTPAHTLTDTFTATTIDGTSQAITITINGANDAAVISGDITGTVLEAGGVANGTLGNPTATGDLTSADVDNPGDGWQAVRPAPPPTAPTPSTRPGRGPTRSTTAIRRCRRSMRAIS